MGFQYIACRDNPFLESESGVAQVLISLFQVLLRHDKFLGRFVYLENRLADLQFYLFFGIVQLVPADACFGLGGFYLVDAFSPVPDRYADHDAYVPHALELVFEAVEYGRIGCHIVSDERYGRQEFRTGHVHFLLIDLCGEFQTAHFRSCGIYTVHIDAAVVGRGGEQVVFLLVCQSDGSGKV